MLSDGVTNRGTTVVKPDVHCNTGKWSANNSETLLGSVTMLSFSPKMILFASRKRLPVKEGLIVVPNFLSCFEQFSLNWVRIDFFLILMT